MELLLKRSYFENGTNGWLFQNGHLMCYTIELPWRNNRPNHSCIPEGRYQLKKRYSLRWGIHLEVTCVPGRSFILFHPANYALKQLRGCIAPVSYLAEPGVGWRSAVANDALKGVVFPVLDKGEEVWLDVEGG